MESNITFSMRWVGGWVGWWLGEWVVRDLESKATQSQSWSWSWGWAWQKSSNGPPFGSFSRAKSKWLIFWQKDQHIKSIISCKLGHFPFSKSWFWEGKIFLVQSAAQKWSSLQKMIVLMHWLFWQEMSNFHFSLENDPLDDFFPFYFFWVAHNFYDIEDNCDLYRKISRNFNLLTRNFGTNYCAYFLVTRIPRYTIISRSEQLCTVTLMLAILYRMITLERSSLKEAISPQIMSFWLFDLVVSIIYPKGVPHLWNKGGLNGGFTKPFWLPFFHISFKLLDFL